MVDTPLTIDGPVPPGGTQEFTGPTVPLVLVQDSTISTASDTNPQPVATTESEDSILAPISGVKSFRAKGVVDGSFLAQNQELLPNRRDVKVLAGPPGRYSPANALRLYTFLIESLVMPQQGSGYVLDDNIRDTTLEPVSGVSFGILFDDVRVTYKTGDAFRAEYTVAGKVTEGVQSADDRRKYFDEQKDELVKFTANNAFDRTALEIDGGLSVELGEVEKTTIERTVSLNVADMIHQTEEGGEDGEGGGASVAAIDTGVKRRVTLKGRIADQQTDRSLEKVADIIEIEIHGENLTLYDAVSGRRLRGAVSETSATFVSGNPNRVQYRIDFDEGNFPVGEANVPGGN
jgi:hypothetical protein